MGKKISPKKSYLKVLLYAIPIILLVFIVIYNGQDTEVGGNGNLVIINNLSNNSYNSSSNSLSDNNSLDEAMFNNSMTDEKVEQLVEDVMISKEDLGTNWSLHDESKLFDNKGYSSRRLVYKKDFINSTFKGLENTTATRIIIAYFDNPDIGLNLTLRDINSLSNSKNFNFLDNSQPFNITSGLYVINETYNQEKSYPLYTFLYFQEENILVGIYGFNLGRNRVNLTKDYARIVYDKILSI